MILVTAATGQVGRETVAGLLRLDAPVRALVRDPSRAHGLEQADIVQGSFEDDASLERALVGIESMLLAGRDSPEAVSQHRRVLAHARRIGLRHIIKLSAIGASAHSPITLMREHEEIDDEVRRGPWAWTLIKPHLYMQNLLRAADAVRGDGRLTAPMADARFPLVDTRDVGAAAAMILAAPDQHAGRSYAFTGPAAPSYEEIAAALTIVTGRPVTYEPAPPDAYEARLLAAGMPAWRAFDLAHIAAAYSPSDRVASPDLATILKGAPRSLSEFLGDHGHVFRGASAQKGVGGSI